MQALQHVKVVEIAERPAGEYCGRLLADFGADVLKIERPGRGSPTRGMAPRLGPAGDSVLFAFLNAGKRSLELDLDSEQGMRELQALLASADVLVDDHDANWLRTRWLDDASLRRSFPALVACSITPYGFDAPEDRLPARGLNVFHQSGWGYHNPGNAAPEQPPLKAAGRFLVEYEAAIDAALCVVSALVARGSEGPGEFIDVAERDVMVSRADTVIGRPLAGDVPPSHRRDAFEMGGPAASFACRDGFVFLFMTTAHHWTALGELMGHPPEMDEFPGDWLEFGITDERVATFRRIFAAWVADREKGSVSEAAQARGIPLAPFNHARDVYASAQLHYRDYFQTLAHPGLGSARYPTQPLRLSATPLRLARGAPALGEHRTPAGEATSSGVSRGDGDSGTGGRAVLRPRGGPLQGVRVLELAKVWAGPYAGKLLALLGAEVIKVESESRLDEMRAYGGTDINKAPYFLCLNPEVLSVQLDMKTREGLQQLRSLVARSDIVLDNLRPGAMAKAGLDSESLRAIKGDIVAVSIKMFGADGPLGYQTGFAPSFAALGGLSLQVGYPEGPPSGMNMRYGDATVGAWAALGAVVALAHARRTGEGQFVDVSAVECMSSMIGDSLLAYDLTGDYPVADGNAHADMAPHGCYPCRDGEWLSIAVADERQWKALCRELGLPDLDARAASRGNEASRAEGGELDSLIAQATRERAAETLAMRLRAAGVAAARSLSTEDILRDELLWRRGTFRTVSDRSGGTRPVIAAPWRLSRNAARVAEGAPLLGEHNEYVFCKLLGLTPAELRQLVARGAAR